MQTPGNTTRIIRLLALALAAHIVLSWPLWYAGGGRTFPLLPAWGGAIAPSTSPLDLVQIGCFMAVLGLVAVFPAKKYAVPSLAAALLWMVAQDLNRLQPWSYFYLLALGILLVSGHQSSRAEVGLRWLLAAVYAWGGFNKITPYFAEDNFAWFCEAFEWTKPLGAFPAIGYAVAVAELLLAPGLLWKTTRRTFRCLAISFHLFIVLALSPIGLDWNAVVIPWNLVMAGMVWVLFSEKLEFHPVARKPHPQPLPQGEGLGVGLHAQEHDSRVIPQKKVTVGAILALAWLMPVLNIWHLWDEPLSWKMYSNTQAEAGFFLEKDAPCANLIAVWEKHAYDSGRKLLFDDWAFDNLHVPAYNSRRTHKHLAQYLCPCANAPAHSGLWRFTVKRWDSTGERWESVPCTTLIR